MSADYVTTTLSAPTVRTYRGCNIYPRDHHGMYETYVGGSFHKADTLEGMRATIREILDGAR